MAADNNSMTLACTMPLFSSLIRYNDQVVIIDVPLDELVDFICLLAFVVSMDEKLIIYIGLTFDR